MEQIIQSICEEQPHKVVISNPVNSKVEYRKIVITRKYMKERELYQIEKFTEKQAFHINIEQSDLPAVLLSYMETDFRQMNAWTQQWEYDVKLSKKGKLLFHKRANTSIGTDMPKQLAGNNKCKKYLLEEGVIVPPLVDLGVLTQDGKVVHAMYDKYKQINRFLEMVDDVLKNYKQDVIHIIDFGCGKSYLTFVLYYYLVEIRGMQAEITGLDLKADVIKRCNETARRYQYTGLKFELGDINGYQTETPVDMVITLHACDTATDYALYNAIQWNAQIILSVPCCQHEWNAGMETKQLAALTKYGIIKERVSALMTDAVRGCVLEASGYKTQLLEFIDIAHSPKNILIRAVKTKVSSEKKEQALREAKQLTSECGVTPTLMRLLKLDK